MAKRNTARKPSTREPLTRLATGLPSSWYYDPTQYARDLEVFWYRRWIATCRAEEIAEEGDWRVVRIGTQSIVLLRGEQGELRAFHNTCRHRGSILCTDNTGRFARRRIVCPYHSWTYDFGGNLIATPRRMPTPDFDPKKFSLFEVATATWGGFVFVNLAGRKDRRSRNRLAFFPTASRATVSTRCGSESASSPMCMPTGSCSSRISPNAFTARRCTRSFAAS